MLVCNVNSGELLLEFGRRGKMAGEMWAPSGLTFDGDGNLLVADSKNQRIQVIRCSSFLVLYGSDAWLPLRPLIANMGTNQGTKSAGEQRRRRKLKLQIKRIPTKSQLKGIFHEKSHLCILTSVRIFGLDQMNNFSWEQLFALCTRSSYNVFH